MGKFEYDSGFCEKCHELLDFTPKYMHECYWYEKHILRVPAPLLEGIQGPIVVKINLDRFSVEDKK